MPDARTAPERRAAYRAFYPVSTRWADNDIYGHVNNVAYYSFFDTAVNAHLIAAGVLDIHGGDVIGLVAESGCRYFKALAYPQLLSVGLRVAHLGRSSVRYELGVFAEHQEQAAAMGHFVHVYVDSQSRRPIELTGQRRAVLSALMLSSGGPQE